MNLPWHYRPDMGDHEFELDQEPESWEYNVISNTMAWVSDTFWPAACKSPDHWTVRFVLYLWADCACCLFFRGVAVGALPGALVGTLVGLLL